MNVKAKPELLAYYPPNILAFRAGRAAHEALYTSLSSWQKRRRRRLPRETPRINCPTACLTGISLSFRFVFVILLRAAGAVASHSLSENKTPGPLPLCRQ